jgi:hypothetical protein
MLAGVLFQLHFVNHNKGVDLYFSDFKKLMGFNGSKPSNSNVAYKTSLPALTFNGIKFS